MNIFKKIFFIGAIILGLAVSDTALAMTPTFNLTVDSNNNSFVQINVNGDVNAPVILGYYSTTLSGLQMSSLGRTSSSGYFSGTIDLNQYKIVKDSAVKVFVNNTASIDTAWPYGSNTSSNTNLTFDQSSAVVKVGQSITVNVSGNNSGTLYLSSNSNPQVANFSFNGNQVTVSGITQGQTTANICVINTTSSNANNCASLYVVAQNSSAQNLSFSQNDTSIISGQNIIITISGGNGFYQIQNNSNPSIISTNLSGPSLTIYANGSTGSSTITVCSIDLASCGLVKASIGNYTSNGTGLSFNQSRPTIFTNGTTNVSITGGYGNYYISSNSNTTIAQTYITNNTLTIYGNNPGTSLITVCAPSGQCGTVTAEVVAVSGGKLTLSQSSVNMTAGQIVSVVISGGTIPYSLIQTNDGVAQYSLTGNTVTVTGIRSGSSSTTVCSSAGGCLTLTVFVTSNSTTVSGVQPSFSQNNVAVNSGQTTSVYLSGNGGYYISNNSSTGIASASISGNTLVITGILTGSSNVTVCQTGSQCNTVYITVSNPVTTTTVSTAITFDKTYGVVNVGENVNVNVFGGLTNANYISANTNAEAASATLANNVLTITGKTVGFTNVTICSTTSNCASLFVIVSAKKVTNTTANINKYVFTKPLKFGMTSSEVRELQVKLKELGYLTATPTGYYGNQTVAAVKKFQKAKGLEQLGSVGPGTRAALNK